MIQHRNALNTAAWPLEKNDTPITLMIVPLLPLQRHHHLDL